jgi:divalent metal cation (Fe/Co/Zn/Cd) transporter
MSNNSGYKEQRKLSFVQILVEVPSFVAILVSAILSGNLLVFIDLFDSFMYIISLSLVVVLSKKLTKDLRYEYNYGVGKIEAISSLLCDGIAFFGLLLALGLSIYKIIFPEQPSDLVIAVVGLKVINIIFDTVFYVKQHKITKIQNSAILKANYAEALSALLYDSVALVSLFVMWLFRDNPIGGYISPVVSIFVAIYLMFGYVKRTRQALIELTDKTLPEEKQMKILSILNKYYSNYSQFHSVNSHKSGDVSRIDIHLSFENNTSFEEIINFKKQIQDEFDSQFCNCIVNIIVESI